jgi:hypothetical protein
MDRILPLWHHESAQDAHPLSDITMPVLIEYEIASGLCPASVPVLPVSAGMVATGGEYGFTPRLVAGLTASPHCRQPGSSQ